MREDGEVWVSDGGALRGWRPGQEGVSSYHPACQALLLPKLPQCQLEGGNTSCYLVWRFSWDSVCYVTLMIPGCVCVASPLVHLEPICPWSRPLASLTGPLSSSVGPLSAG